MKLRLVDEKEASLMVPRTCTRVEICFNDGTKNVLTGREASLWQESVEYAVRTLTGFMSTYKFPELPWKVKESRK